MAIKPGSRVGPYRIHRPIGRGGFATVYLASDDRLDTDVAVKVLADNWALDAEVRSRFIREGQQLRAARGPSIVAVHDIGETEAGQPYLVLEHADRRTLADRLDDALAAGVGVTPDDVLAIADALCEALAVLHRLQLVHRDISPSNVLITGSGGSPPWSGTSLLDPDERLVIADLGLVKDLAASSGVTASAGTDAFQAPEQRQVPSIVDARTDVFAASAVIGTVLTGSSDPNERRRAVEQLPVFRDPLLRGLSVDPAGRQPTIEAWRAEIEPLGSSPSPPEAAAASVWAAPSRWWWSTLVAVAAMAFGALVVLAVTALGGGEQGDVRREEIRNGLVVNSASDAGLTLSVTAPATIEVGRTASASATIDGDAPLFWLDRDGSYLDGGRPLDVSPRSTGSFKIVAVALLADGRTLVVDHEATAVERPSDD